MKKSTKLAIGFGVAAVAGVATAAIVSEKVITKVRHASNRRQLRKIVATKLDGNEKVLNVVDNLSDKDIASVLNVVDKVNEGKDQLAHYGNNVKDAAVNATNNVRGYVESKF